nr:MAG TPA: hypothetical protein [Caudoviricetes sp.]
MHNYNHEKEELLFKVENYESKVFYLLFTGTFNVPIE